MVTVFESWRKEVAAQMVLQGWGPSGAQVELAQADPGYLERLYEQGLFPIESARQVIKDALIRQQAIKS